MRVAIAKESCPGERRVALAPTGVGQLVKAGWEVLAQRDCGNEAGFADEVYVEAGASLVTDRDEVFAADVVVQVCGPGANRQAGAEDLPRLRPDQLLIAMCDPLGSPESVRDVAATGATLFALEMVPRITRAQAMDVLSSMATVAGYRAVLAAAVELPKMFPLMMTAAGTISAARVLVIGAGVAGLQAIATARRLGAVVQAYDVRPACREQVESLGAKFVELDLQTGESEDAGGYAKALGDDFYQQQQQLLGEVVAQHEVVITTAAVPGKAAPRLITDEAVQRMPLGSVIVDLAAERGGNCGQSRPDERVVYEGVTILGPTNLPSEAPLHASQLFSGNVTKFLLHLTKDGQLVVDESDQIVSDTMVAHNGEVVHPRIRELLGLAPPPAAEPAAEPAEPTGGDEPESQSADAS